MTEPIISVSGLRGVVGDTLTPQVANRYASAFAHTVPEGGLVVTRDGRASGLHFADMVCQTLNSLGRDVINAGVAATPTTGVLIRDLKFSGGIQISASHNPAEYNGIKLFGPDGRVISAGLGQQILDRYRRPIDPLDDQATFGTVRSSVDTISTHAKLVLKTVDADSISAKKYKVVLDSNHGAGSLLGRKLLNRLGCDFQLLGTPPDGQFEHLPEPTAENLKELCGTITENHAQVGFAQDPDADRLALIDETGRYVGEEYTLAVCLDYVLRHTPGPVVTNCSTSRMSEDLATRYGVPFFRSKVGEANVCDLMIEKAAIFGGEGNGGPIDPRVGYVRDSFVGMALVLASMAEQDKPLSVIVDDLPRYEIHKTKVALAQQEIADLEDRLREHFADATADTMDGLRLDWPGRWLLVRASNTEPIMRIIAEAESAKVSQKLCEEARDVIAT
jgi:phosphomannomutase